ncbi:MAG: phosphopantetheine-binding protein, partial [Pseudonocardiaceae bacterium]
RMNKIAADVIQEDGALSSAERELAQLIVTTLNLEVQVADIDPLAPLYGEGLGLDSIDVLEVALVVSKSYGVQLRSDDENNLKIFSSLRSLNQHIQQHRTK